MTAVKLVKHAPARLARLDEPDAHFRPTPVVTAPDEPDPHAVLFRTACARMVAEFTAHRAALIEEAADALHVVVRAIAPTLIDAGARDSFRSLMRSVGRNDEIIVEIRAHSDTIAMLSQSDPAAARFLPDDSMPPGDFRAVWPHGGMTRNANGVIESVLALLSQSQSGASNG